jgi:tripartite-type tricarboxylate transporter receptor subunit TctC
MITMLMGGHIDAIWSSASSLEQYEQAGKIEIVAVNSPRRIETFPNTPTFKEIGVDMPQGAKWVIISNNTADAATVRQIDQAVNRLLINPSFVQNLKELGITVELKLSNQSRSTILTTLQQQSKFAEYVRSRNAK